MSREEKIEIYAKYFGMSCKIAEKEIDTLNLSDEWFEERKDKVYEPLTDD